MKRLVLTLLLIISVALSACVPVQDVTNGGYFHGEDIWKSYKRNGIYQLKRDLFYGRAFSPEYQDIYYEGELFPPWGEPGEPRASRFVDRDSRTGRSFEVVPESIKAFNNNPKEWPHIKGVIPKGTRLRMWRVLLYKPLNLCPLDRPARIYYIAVLMDGPFADRSVLLNRISAGGIFDVNSVDSSYLEQVDK